MLRCWAGGTAISELHAEMLEASARYFPYPKARQLTRKIVHVSCTRVRQLYAQVQYRCWTMSIMEFIPDGQFPDELHLCTQRNQRRRTMAWAVCATAKCTRKAKCEQSGTRWKSQVAQIQPERKRSPKPNIVIRGLLQVS